MPSERQESCPPRGEERCEEDGAGVQRIACRGGRCVVDGDEANHGGWDIEMLGAVASSPRGEKGGTMGGPRFVLAIVEVARRNPYQAKCYNILPTWSPL